MTVAEDSLPCSARNISHEFRLPPKRRGAEVSLDTGEEATAEGGAMFESLDDVIKHDDEVETTKQARYLKWLTILVVSVVIFGGLYLGLRLFQYHG